MQQKKAGLIDRLYLFNDQFSFNHDVHSSLISDYLTSKYSVTSKKKEKIILDFLPVFVYEKTIITYMQYQCSGYRGRILTLPELPISVKDNNDHR